MKCKKCGQEIDKNAKQCPNCGTEINKKEKDVEAISCVVIFILSLLGALIFPKYIEVFLVICLISIVTGIITCSNNSLIRILFVVFLLFVGIYFFMGSFLNNACDTLVGSCPG